MPGKRHSIPEILGILAEKNDDISVAELCSRHQISEQTYYRWKARHGRSASILPMKRPGTNDSVASRLAALEEENQRLKILVADLLLQQSYRGAG